MTDTTQATKAENPLQMILLATQDLKQITDTLAMVPGINLLVAPMQTCLGHIHNAVMTEHANVRALVEGHAKALEDAAAELADAVAQRDREAFVTQETLALVTNIKVLVGESQSLGAKKTAALKQLLAPGADE